MAATYTPPLYPYRRSPDQGRGAAAHHPVVIVGAGPVGLTAALDLALRGVPVVLLDESDTVSHGSRAICFAKRTLELWDRMGVAARMTAKGVTWNLGKLFFRDRLVFEFNLLPEPGHKFPAFINLQQYWVEQYLVERLAALPGVELRWRHRLAGLRQERDRVRLAIETPEGGYTISASYLLACDGAKSTVRQLLGLELEGRTFEDRFLIADVVMNVDFPAERRFWFDPPFNPGQSALLHKQPDRVWRIDLQLGREADPTAERRAERVVPRIRAMLGAGVDFALEWVSVYSFRCARVARFRHGRVFLAGDAAHVVSPFGARGGNGGLQDVDNLCWKLALVLQGKAPAALLDSYELERVPAADENIRYSTWATDFISPKSAASRAFRDATLELAAFAPFARAMVNSGRLSRPARLVASPLNSPDEGTGLGGPEPGTAAIDAPVRTGSTDAWLLEQLRPDFTALCFGEPPADLGRLSGDSVPIRVLCVGRDLHDPSGLLAERYGGEPGTWVLFRPDQHVAARGRGLRPETLRAARDRALAGAMHAEEMA